MTPVGWEFAWLWPLLIGAGLVLAIALYSWRVRRLGTARPRGGPDMPYRTLLARCMGRRVLLAPSPDRQLSRVASVNVGIAALAAGYVLTLWGRRGGCGPLVPISGRYWQDGGTIDDDSAALTGRGRAQGNPLDPAAPWYDDLHFSTLQARRLLRSWSGAMIRTCAGFRKV